MNATAFLAALGVAGAPDVERSLAAGGLPLVTVAGRPVTFAGACTAEAMAVAAHRGSALLVVAADEPGDVATGPAAGTVPPRAAAPSGPGDHGATAAPWPIVAVGRSPWTVRGADLGLLVGVTGPADRDRLDEPAAATLANGFLTAAFDGPARPPASDRSLLEIVPFALEGTYDVADVLAAVLDDGAWVELDAGAAPEVLTAVARLDGRSVGVAASRPSAGRGGIGPAGAARIERLVRFCEAAPGGGRPLITVVDTDGVRLTGPGPGGAPHADAVAAVRGAATAVRRSPVPKVAVVAGRAVGLGATLLAAVGGRADMVLPWPRARFALAPHDPPVDALDAAREADVVDIIHPDDTRARLVEALELLRGTREYGV